MTKQILKQIWNERSSNAWLWAELLIVSVVLWIIVDWGYVTLRTYLQPKGFNIENTYLLRFNELTPKSNLYIPAGNKTTTTGEDLLDLVERLRHRPDVEAVSVSVNSFPYNGSNSNNSLQYDTLSFSRLVRRVTPDFFNVFRYENVDGSGSQSLVDAFETNTMIVGANIMPDDYLYKGNLKDLSFYANNDSSTRYKVAAVTKEVRYSEFSPLFNMRYYATKLEETTLAKYNGADINYLEICLRVKEGASPGFAEHLMKDSPRLYMSGNCYVKSIQSFDVIRKNFQADDMKEVKTRGYIVFFLLTNIFLGIIGTYWFRTQQRRGEMGLRIALGSTPGGLKKVLISEGLLILILAFIPSTIICYNIGHADLARVWQMEWGPERFIPGILIMFLLMALMIIIGILYPAQQVTKIQPAEALHEN